MTRADAAVLRNGRGATRAGVATAVLLGVSAAVASGVVAQAVTDEAGSIAVGAAVTAVLAGLARVAGSVRGVAASARPGLLALAALSVFPWASSAIVAIPSVAHWTAHAPVALVFLVVNATKLTSVVPLLLIARRDGWTRQQLLLVPGRRRARSCLGLRWAWLAVMVVLAVEALFLTTPGLRSDALPQVARWLPVMLAGALVNAACEELLYRHALITTTCQVLGTRAAVLLSSATFGLAHVHGTPGGVVGVAYTFCFGTVCALAMLQARGARWNLLIHVGGDLSAVSTLMLT